MATIVRGTTPSLIIDFSDVSDVSVSDITAVSLVFKRRTEKIEYGLSDMSVTENTLSYHFTQEETLALTSGEIITVDMHIVANGERYKICGIPDRIRVENTEKNEVM